MAGSKRGGKAASLGRSKGGGGGKGRGLLRMRRLSTVDLAINGTILFVGGPALLVLAVMSFNGDLGGTDTNQHLFLGGVMVMIVFFIVLLNGLKVMEHVKARRRFRTLLAGDSKKSVMGNVDELTHLARELGPPYRRQLDDRLGELGLKR